MFCGKCGKKIEEGCLVCPHCGYERAASVQGGLPEQEQLKTENDVEGRDELRIVWEEIKGFIREHPMRTAMCILIIVYLAYLFCTIFTYDFYNALRGHGMMGAFIDLLPVFVKITFCESGIWLIYGPRNYAHTKELLTGRRQKGGGMVSHIVEFFVAAVLLLIYWLSE